jgi:2-polyprenyl-6-methoxyphenol hydroxylase-like FAD-dependent oxidoreductase
MCALAISKPDARLTNERNISLAEIAQSLQTGFDPPLKQMVLEAEPEETLLLPLRASKVPPRWKSPSLTLMGDAAHLMPPFGARGGNTALRDPALLADCFSNHPTWTALQERLQRYQQEMLGYGFKQVKSAKGMMRLALGRNALLRFAVAKDIERLSCRTTARRSQTVNRADVLERTGNHMGGQ